MEGEVKERWLELCERATHEQDPSELVKLLEEINRLLCEKEERMKQQRSSSETAA